MNFRFHRLLFSGYSEAIASKGIQTKKYTKTAALLTALRTRLSGLGTRATIGHTISQTEEILLNELREWQLTTTTTGH